MNKQVEKCESQVSNLLASMDNLPSSDFKGKLKILSQIIVLQQKQIEELKVK